MGVLYIQPVFLYSHNVIHLPLLSGFAGVAVGYKDFVKQVWSVQTFSCAQSNLTNHGQQILLILCDLKA